MQSITKGPAVRVASCLCLCIAQKKSSTKIVHRSAQKPMSLHDATDRRYCSRSKGVPPLGQFSGRSFMLRNLAPRRTYMDEKRTMDMPTVRLHMARPRMKGSTGPAAVDMHILRANDRGALIDLESTASTQKDMRNARTTHSDQRTRCTRQPVNGSFTCGMGADASNTAVKHEMECTVSMTMPVPWLTSGRTDLSRRRSTTATSRTAAAVEAARCSEGRSSARSATAKLHVRSKA
mmetsp:Transcript_25946/g.76053  ORF Transcript_25946/g.76053 Transcript_25946/m.76053 type:complete len:235 (+) Transcript_25946:1441-2145(+)